jgi:hypothetical protein
MKNRWDGILDTGSPDPVVLLLSAQAMLDFRAEGREILFPGQPDARYGERAVITGEA